jgi:nucleotide-binding universal stress UspA family protein
MFKKIIWSTDGSESADRALELAKSLASEDGAEVLAVHSVDYLVGAHGGLPENADADERRVKIEQQVAELAGQGVNISSRVVQAGSTGAAHTVATVAEEVGADVIVIGTRGQTPLKGLMLGSVVQRLLHLAPCPVLVVPAEHDKG